MENRVEDLKKYIVRIKENHKYLGSGVLWKPQQNEENHIYIFTAAHVLKNYDEIEVEFLRNNEVVNLSVDRSMIVISETYQNEGDFGDVAIITLNYVYNELPSFRFISFHSNLQNIYEGKKLIMLGFPKEGYLNQSFELSMETMELRYASVDNNISMLKYKLDNSNIDQSNRNEEMEGFSGAGLFYDVKSEFIFVGIHKGSIGSGGERGSLIGTTSDFVRNMCSKNKLDVPIQMNEINGNLSDQIEYFKEEILEDLEQEDTIKVLSLLDEVIKQDMAEAINGIFYDFCNECKYKTNYHQCKNFRGFLLILSVFLKAVNGAVDLKSPQISASKEIPVYFVCSEGMGRNTQAQLKMNHFVYALKSQKELSHRLEDNCIIIWGSEKQPRDSQKKCSYSRFKNVLIDITHMPDNALNITSIFKEPHPKAIVHIDEIITMLRNGKLQKLEEKFIEYIGELEK